MKYVIRRRKDDKYLSDFTEYVPEYAPKWSKNLSEAFKMNIETKEYLSLVLGFLKNCGYDEKDLLIYTVVNPS